MDMIATNKPIVKLSEKQLMRYQTIAHYALSGIYEEMKTATEEEMVDLFIARNKYRMIAERIKSLLESK
jgi:peptidase E